MESNKDFYSTSLNKDKKKFLSKLSEEKKTKEKLKDLSHSQQAILIQRTYRFWHSRKEFIMSILKTVQSKLKDIGSVKTMLKKPDFKLPIPILQDFIRDLSFLSEKKSLVFEEVLNYLKLSFESENPKENILRAWIELLTTAAMGIKRFTQRKQELLTAKLTSPLFLKVRLVLFMKKTTSSYHETFDVEFFALFRSFFNFDVNCMDFFV